MIYYNTLRAKNLTFENNDGPAYGPKLSGYHRMDYPCIKCAERATSMERLKIHMDESHDGVRYICDLCDEFSGNLGV